MKTDISKNELYISRLLLVMQNYIPTRSIPLCRPRRSDAFVFILGGSCKYTFDDGKRLEASRGSILYLAKGAVYSMEVCGRYDFICADFFFDGDEERQSDLFLPKDTEAAENTFYRLLRKYAGGEGSLPGSLSLLYRIYETVIVSRENAYLSTGARQKIAEAKAAVLTCLADPDLSVSDLAKKASMSEVHFRALFRETCGCAPSKFITDCRLSLAKELLALNYLSLEEIAERCGFSSTSYFCRVFKKNLGQTAAEYRRKLLP